MLRRLPLDKSWNLIVGPGKSWKIKVMFGELVIVECQSRDNRAIYTRKNKTRLT